MPDEYTTPERWPWRGDSKLGQIQRIALAYRSLCESLVFGALPDPQAALAAEDAEWIRYGHHWVKPSSAPQPDLEEWVSVRDCAHYISQYYPCTPRNVHDWIQRGHIEHKILADGTAVVLWGSVMDYDQRRNHKRRLTQLPIIGETETTMSEPQSFRKKPVEVQAMQWNGTDARADDLYEWTATRYPSSSGGQMLAIKFMVLGEDDSYEVFRCYDEDLELLPGNDVDRLSAEGYSAVLFVAKSGQWANLRDGDWVIRESDGSGFYPCAADVFATTFDPIPS